MNTLAALRRAAAFGQGRAVTRASRRHLHLTDMPLVVTLHTVSGEAFAPWALVWGTDPSRPAGSVVIAEPRNRTRRYQGLATFAAGLCDYLDGYLSYEMVRPRRSGAERPVTESAPQIVVPSASAARALVRVAGRGPHGITGIPPALAWCSAHLTWFGQHLETDGQALLVPAATALAYHHSTGQADIEDENLPSVLSWITSASPTRAGRLADIAAAERHTWGDLRDPDRDRLLMTLVDRYNIAEEPRARQAAARDISDEVLPTLLDAYRGTHQALALLRTLPAAQTAAERWDADLRAWAWHARRCDAPQPPSFTVRDNPAQAMRNVAELETARARFAAQPAYDDPLLLAELLVDGHGLQGDVEAVDTTHMEVKPDGQIRPSKVPLVTVRTRIMPPLPVGENVWWVANRAVSGEIRTIAPASCRATDPPGADPHTVQIALLSGHQYGRRVPAVGAAVTFAALDPNPSSPIRPAIAVPWPLIRQGAARP